MKGLSRHQRLKRFLEVVFSKLALDTYAPIGSPGSTSLHSAAAIGHTNIVCTLGEVHRST
jgi:hypothetical protein